MTMDMDQNSVNRQASEAANVGNWSELKRLIVDHHADPLKCYPYSLETVNSAIIASVMRCEFSPVKPTTPSMAHHLAGKNVFQLKGWIQTLLECGLHQELKDALNQYASSENFGVKSSVLYSLIDCAERQGLDQASHVQLCEQLMDLGSDPHQGQEASDRSCLAALMGDHKSPERMMAIGELLLKKGLNPYTEKHEGFFFLGAATKDRNEELLKWGIQKGFKGLSAFEALGRPTLESLTIKACSIELGKKILSLEAFQSILSVDKDQINTPSPLSDLANTPLHQLSRPFPITIRSAESKKLHLELLKALLEAGADTQAKNAEGLTALENVSQYESYPDIVGLLVAFEERKKLQNAAGSLPVDLDREAPMHHPYRRL